MSDLPAVFYIEGVGVAEPCYKLIAPIHADDTYWNEGEILCTEMTPNEAMQPLNRAAGDRVDRWLDTLPANGNIRPEDYMAAALQLRPKVGDEEMPHDAWIAAVRQLALQMRAKAEGKEVKDLRPVRAVKPNAAIPVMPNVDLMASEQRTRPKPQSNKPGRVKHMAQGQPNRVQNKPDPVGTILTHDPQQPTS